MQQYLERLQQARIMLFQEASKKRVAESDLTESEPKRIRTDDSATLESGRFSGTTLSQLFSLTNDNSARNFNISAIPTHTVQKIIVPMLKSIDKGRLDAALAVSEATSYHCNANSSQLVRTRIAAAQSAANGGVNSVANDVDMAEDEEEYEPDYEPMEDAEQVKNRLEMESSDDLGIGIPKPSQLNIGPFILPAPPPLQKSDLQLLALSTMDRMFRRIDMAPKEPHPRPQLFTAEKLHTPATDRNSMAKSFARLLTRPSTGMLSEIQTNGAGRSKASHSSENGTISTSSVKSLTDRGRVQLLQYILNDWTRRMDMATTWLTEEWYNDRLAQKAHDESTDKDGSGGPPPAKNYPRWIHRFLDELSAFIGGEHAKLLIRFVSEIPGIDFDIVAKIKRLALDPERIGLVVSALQ
jgi:symplekin